MVGFEKRDEIRYAFSAPVLSGCGLEIGAGAFPQRLPPGATASYYDLRDDREAEELFQAEVVAARPMSAISSDFPSGADFLIAHNVLEHCPDPIGVLLGWHRHIRSGGHVVISLPHHQYCPDRGRRLPSLAHLIEDFLCRSDGRDFASREHSASFTLGWAEDFCSHEKITNVESFSQRLLNGLHRDDHDLHWHALDTSLSLGIVEAASTFGQTAISDLRCWSPESGQTVGDILVSYKIQNQEDHNPDVDDLVNAAKVLANRMNRLTAMFATRITALRSREAISEVLSGPFRREGRYACVTSLPPEFKNRMMSGMAFSVREDGKTLGLGNSLHEDIREKGHGIYSFWSDNVYFSSSDGTDCNINGRKYSIVGEWVFGI